jgi:hypothetical protein
VNELLLLIEDMFRIKDRGYVATGNLSSGPIRVGDRVWVSTVQGYFRFDRRFICSDCVSGVLAPLRGEAE